MTRHHTVAVVALVLALVPLAPRPAAANSISEREARRVLASVSDTRPTRCSKTSTHLVACAFRRGRRCRITLGHRARGPVRVGRRGYWVRCRSTGAARS